MNKSKCMIALKKTKCNECDFYDHKTKDCVLFRDKKQKGED